MPTLDLNAIPLFRLDGQDRNDLPGLYMATPPRRAGRGRENDRLILYFAMLGSAPLPPEQIDPLLVRLAQVYYKTPGSITAAMRSGADHLNLYLLDRNLRSSSTGRQGVGLLTLGVLREERLTLAHCGPTHTFVLTSQETQHLHDPQGSRGLGLTRAVALRYFQIELHPNDLLVLTAQPPPAWTALTLQSVQSLGIETLRRRLLGHAGPELSAVIFQAQVGTGKLRLLHPKAPIQMATPLPGAAEPAASPEARPGVEAQPAVEAGQPFEDEAPAENGQPEAGTPLASEAPPASPEAGEATESLFSSGSLPAAPPPWEAAGPPAADERPENGLPERLPLPEPGLENTLEENGFELLARAETDGGSPFFESPVQLEPAKERPAAASSVVGGLAPTVQASPALSAEAPPGERRISRPTEAERPVASTRSARTRRLPRLSLMALQRGFAPAGQALGKVFKSLASGLHTLLKRMLPDESLFNIPASTMIFVAVAVAVIVATTGGAVYFQRGRQVQYSVFFEQANQEAQLTEGQTDPNEVRTGWETVVDFLDKAETYQVTEASKALRQQALGALDGLDYIQRVDFQRAIPGGLGSQVLATRLVVNENDLYFLNSNGGNVLRAFRTGSGYELDTLFECGPNPQIGALIDIAPLPEGSDFEATLLAMDARGNLLYCIPGAKPVARFPNIPQPTEQGMRAFALDGRTLYVLDPGNNAVWFYRRMEIDQPPHTYFGPDRPDDVQGIIDMAVNRDDLYLLHKDGYIVKCTFGGLQESPTRCEDPAMLVDPRPGRSSGPVIRDARFDQILYSPPPDPSLYLLDPVNGSIYHFGLRLTFQRQVRPNTSLTTDSSAATAFAITQNRTLFLVAGSQLYTALLP